MVAEFELDRDEDPASAVLSSEPILEIYNPIHQPWSGEVIAVAEFYEHAIELNQSLGSARWKSWLAIVGVAGTFFLILSAIVFKGSRTIESQRHALGARVEELAGMLQQNQELSNRVRSAAQKTAALNERLLRRVSADLHDGPLQLLAYASMRIDSPLILDGRGSGPDRKLVVETIQKSINEATNEIRTICRGLALPDIEASPIAGIMERVVAAYEARTGAHVAVSIQGAYVELPLSARICIYRFVQEALNNGWKHAEGQGQRVEQWLEKGSIAVAVSDSGPGIRGKASHSQGLGLSGLKERIESIGGRFEVMTCSTGTRLKMSLTIGDLEAA